MKRFLLLALVLPLNVLGMNKVLESPVTKENAWLVHVTRFFPKNGLIVAGVFPQATMSGETIDIPQSLLVAQANMLMSSLRSTIHWSLNSLVYPHDYSFTDGKKLTTDARESFNIILLEPFAAFEDVILRGYWQDVNHIGNHQLSENSIIFVSERVHDKVTKYVGNYRGRIITFSGSARHAVESFLKEKGAPLLVPKMDTSAEAPRHSNPTQLVMHHKEEFQPSVIEEALNLRNRPVRGEALDGNPFAKLQASVVDVISFWRPVLMIAFFRHSNQIYESIDQNWCAHCHIKADSQVKLMQCAGCVKISYCSKACQIKGWANHKRYCSFLKGTEKHDFLALKEHKLAQLASASMFRDLHCQMEYSKYNESFGLLHSGIGTNNGVPTLPNVLGLFDALSQKAHDESTSEKEKAIIKAYQAYYHEILNCFFSPDEPYESTRQKYVAFGNDENIGKFEEFLHLVAKKVRPLEDRLRSL